MRCGDQPVGDRWAAHCSRREGFRIPRSAFLTLSFGLSALSCLPLLLPPLAAGPPLTDGGWAGSGAN